ncbi:UNVERIFIED_CONTAM: hypothetical protein K2H54_015052 [Gekko kuhli]
MGQILVLCCQSSISRNLHSQSNLQWPIRNLAGQKPHVAPPTSLKTPGGCQKSGHSQAGDTQCQASSHEDVFNTLGGGGACVYFPTITEPKKYMPELLHGVLQLFSQISNKTGEGSHTCFFSGWQGVTQSLCRPPTPVAEARRILGTGESLSPASLLAKERVGEQGWHRRTGSGIPAGATAVVRAPPRRASVSVGDDRAREWGARRMHKQGGRGYDGRHERETWW